MGKKKMAVANFNVVFFEGANEKPLLDCFETIAYPAFKSGVKRVSGGAEYFFMDVEIAEESEGDLVLKGKLIKKTILEIKSDIDEMGNLVEKDDRYSTAPYSMFVIYLRNHRMIYIENQKGSPSLKSFSAMARHVLNVYVRDNNKIYKEEHGEELPIPVLNVVGIPRREDLEKILKDVERVNTLTLKFMPLNGDGDVDLGNVFNNMTTELMRTLNFKSGEIVIKSPQNMLGIIEVIDKAQGTVEPVFRVTYPDKTKKTIKHDIISESMSIDIPGDNIHDCESAIVQKGKAIKSISYVSEENNKIYERSKAKIIPFIKERESRRAND